MSQEPLNAVDQAAAPARPRWRDRLAAAAASDALYPLLLVACLTFMVVVPWHALNQHLPIWDSADFVQNAQTILQRMRADFIDGIEALYLSRGWRPLIFPALAVPFFGLADGRILAGVALTQYATGLLLAGYLYLFFRRTLSSQRALVAVSLILGLRWLVGFSSAFYAELMWIAAGAGLLYHLFRGLEDRSTRHLIIAGFWLGVMGALRPVETGVLAALPAFVLLASEWWRSRIRAAEMFWYAVQLALTAMAVGLLTQPDRGRVFAAALLCAAVGVVGWRGRRVVSGSPAIAFLLSAQFVALAWHLPTIRALYLWAYDTSFGPLARLTDQKFLAAPPWTIFIRLLEQYSPWVVGAVFLLAVAGLLRGWRDRSDRCAGLAAKLLFTAALMVLPLLLIMSESGTSDMRRVMPAMLLGTVAVLLLALRPAGAFGGVRTVAVVLLAGAQLAVAVATGLNADSALLGKAQAYTGHYRRPAIGPDPNMPVLEGIVATGVSQGRIAAYTYCYRDYENCARLGLPLFEPVALSTLAQERRLPLRVHFFIDDLDFSKPGTLSAQIRLRGFTHVLVDMYDTPGRVNWADPYVQHTKEFIALARGARPEGLALLGCFPAIKRSICVLQPVEAQPVPAPAPKLARPPR